ncbi:cytochrome-c peroxidase [Vibrio methylphosphonaticus]|uniref:cytochrome-c peroxidase n=1 Tax=Vibrio methylphosphonaticus TaxID=2946866 RepID=UPI00202AA3EE|nr:cytochrome c peroxidase [Vibrio methylphosphonaticus]MCL9773851.1 c-type cytochrome [Vibrio methylphosphonaticus]
MRHTFQGKFIIFVFFLDRIESMNTYPILINNINAMAGYMNTYIIKWLVAITLLFLFSAWLLLSFTSPFTISQLEEHEHHSLTSSKVSSSIPLISPIEPSPLNAETKPIAKIGFQLFLDPNLSSNGKVSCESCHHIFVNGAEDSKVSTGVKGAGTRNSPTVFNISHNTRFFWDGSAASLEHQMDGPVHNPLEMDSNWDSITHYVKSNKHYRQQFNEVWRDGITTKNIKHSLVTFMTALTTPNAPFDLYLKGNRHAIDPAAEKGWQKFQSLGCIVCHQGVNIGGNLFQKFGNIRENTHQSEDLGRYNVTGIESDKNVFRVPSLRNVADTPPYFHDGSSTTLEEAIVTMANIQLGQDLDATTVIEISAFLHSLSAPAPPNLKELSYE